MIPLVDVHCHLLAGLDDGPRTQEDALAMCRIAFEDGTRWICATAHQNEHYAEVTPDRIRTAAKELITHLRKEEILLTAVPCAEIMARIDMEEAWSQGDLLSVGDRKQFVLVEMPDGMFVDLRETVQRFSRKGIRVILAHPERHPELLHGPGLIEELVHLGALVQVSSDSVTRPKTAADARSLRRWFRRGIVHVMGSDGHSPRKRLPRMGAAYHEVSRWAGTSVADRVFSTNGVAVLQGVPVRFSLPAPTRKWWFSRFF